MNTFIFSVLQLVLSIALIGLILLQQKGSGLGEIFGGSGNIYSTKRGIDKILYYATIIIAILFFSLSLFRLLLF
jgi:preprotein translocase subunit SecG